MFTPLTDESLLLYGQKHYGKKMANVPASYLIYIHENHSNLPQNLRKYIEENMDDLIKEKDQEYKEIFKEKRAGDY